MRLLDDDAFTARRRTRSGPWYITEESVEDYEDELDRKGDDDGQVEDVDLDDEVERAHEDGYKEGVAECECDEDSEDNDKDD